MGEGGPGRPGAEGGARGGAATSAGPKPARWGAAPEIIRGRLRTRYRFSICAGGAEGGRNGAHGAAVGATKFVRRLRRGGTRCGQKMRLVPHWRGSLSYTLARSCRARFRPRGVALDLCSLTAALPPAVRVTLSGTCLTILGVLGCLWGDYRLLKYHNVGKLCIFYPRFLARILLFAIFASITNPLNT